jgi:hypothetical protein
VKGGDGDVGLFGVCLWLGNGLELDGWEGGERGGGLFLIFSGLLAWREGDVWREEGREEGVSE